MAGVISNIFLSRNDFDEPICNGISETQDAGSDISCTTRLTEIDKLDSADVDHCGDKENYVCTRVHSPDVNNSNIDILTLSNGKFSGHNQISSFSASNDGNDAENQSLIAVKVSTESSISQSSIVGLCDHQLSEKIVNDIMDQIFAPATLGEVPHQSQCDQLDSEVPHQSQCDQLDGEVPHQSQCDQLDEIISDDIINFTNNIQLEKEYLPSRETDATSSSADTNEINKKNRYSQDKLNAVEENKTLCGSSKSDATNSASEDSIMGEPCKMTRDSEVALQINDEHLEVSQNCLHFDSNTNDILKSAHEQFPGVPAEQLLSISNVKATRNIPSMGTSALRRNSIKPSVADLQTKTVAQPEKGTTAYRYSLALKYRPRKSVSSGLHAETNGQNEINIPCVAYSETKKPALSSSESGYNLRGLYNRTLSSSGIKTKLSFGTVPKPASASMKDPKSTELLNSFQKKLETNKMCRQNSYKMGVSAIASKQNSVSSIKPLGINKNNSAKTTKLCAASLPSPDTFRTTGLALTASTSTSSYYRSNTTVISKPKAINSDTNGATLKIKDYPASKDGINPCKSQTEANCNSNKPFKKSVGLDGGVKPKITANNRFTLQNNNSASKIVRTNSIKSLPKTNSIGTKAPTSIISNSRKLPIKISTVITK